MHRIIDIPFPAASLVMLTPKSYCTCTEQVNVHLNLCVPCVLQVICFSIVSHSFSIVSSYILHVDTRISEITYTAATCVSVVSHMSRATDVITSGHLPAFTTTSL